LLQQLDVARDALQAGLPCHIEATSFSAPDGNLIRVRGSIDFENKTNLTVNFGPEFSRRAGVRLTGVRGSQWLPGPVRPDRQLDTTTQVPALFAFVADIWTDSNVERRLSIGVNRGSLSAALVQAIATSAALRRPITLDRDGHAIADAQADASLWLQRAIAPRTGVDPCAV
jgi:hypothetical protein